MRTILTVTLAIMLCAGSAIAQEGDGGGDGGDPGGGISVGIGGGGGGSGGSGPVFEFCSTTGGLSFSNLPQPIDIAISAYNCLQQAEIHSYEGDCAWWPRVPGQPVYAIISGFNNKRGQYCPALFGGNDIVTICNDGRVIPGKMPCQ